MPDWRNLLVPQDAGQFWTAASAIATVLAVFIAYIAARYAARALRLGQTPIVNLVRAGDDAELHSVGPGLALNVLLTDDERCYVSSTFALRPGDRVRVARTDLRDSDGFYIYAQDLSGRWFCTRAVYQGLVWSDGLDVANTFRGRIASWRVPRAARRQLRLTSETSLDYLRAVSSYWTLRGWALRARNWGTWLRIDLPRWLWSFPDARRVERFRERVAAAMPTPGDRTTWLVDIDGEIACWKGPRRARQLSCQWEANDVVCDVELRTEVGAPVRGLLCIHRAAFDALPRDRAQRSHVLRRKFGRYVCRLRPRAPFVFELRKVGPFLVNWP